MKNFKVQLFLLVALLVTAATVSAFTMLDSKPAEPAAINTTWYFTGTQEQILEAEFWRTEDQPEDCAPSGSLPCSISVDATDEGELQLVLNEYEDYEVVGISTNKRP